MTLRHKNTDKPIPKVSLQLFQNLFVNVKIKKFCRYAHISSQARRSQNIATTTTDTPRKKPPAITPAVEPIHKATARQPRTPIRRETMRFRARILAAVPLTIIRAINAAREAPVKQPAAAGTTAAPRAPIARAFGRCFLRAGAAASDRIGIAH